MQIKPVPFRHRGDRGDVVGCAGAGAAHTRDDAGGQQAGGAVGQDRSVECLSIHRAPATDRGNADQIALADSGHPHGAVDGCVHLV